MPLNDNIAKLINFPCESMFYGVYCVLFIIASALLLWYRRPGNGPNIIIIVANTILFFTITLYWAFDFTHYWTTLQSKGVSGFGDQTRITLASDILVQIVDFMNALLLGYRCWVLWGQNYFIIMLPLLTSLAGTCCIITGLTTLSIVNLSASHVPAFLVPMGIAGFTLQVGANLILTSLIAIRIWYVKNKVSGLIVNEKAPWKAVIIVVESGALVLIFQVMFLVLFALQLSAQQVVAGMLMMIYGIAPTLIIIRVTLGISREKSTKEPTLSRISWRRPARRPVKSWGISIEGSEITARDMEMIPQKKDDSHLEEGNGEMTTDF